jgi:integrase
MASLQLRNQSWRIIFQYKNGQHFVTLGQIEEIDAQGVKARYEYLLRLIKQRILNVPAGMSIETFLLHDGKPPEYVSDKAPPQTTFAELRDSYLKTFSSGAIEASTLATAKIHLAHFATTLGEKFPINSLAARDLQKHIDRRLKEKNRSGEPIAPVTISKEIDTLRAAWNWGQRLGYVEGDLPTGGLVYPKSDEKLPFMTKAEIERRLARGGDAEELWECLYLTLPEIAQVLAEIKKRALRPWVYPMACFAAHTGARRSEMLRAERVDVDLHANVVTIREKKRSREKRTTRRVPVSPFLAEVLREWMLIDLGTPLLFWTYPVEGKKTRPQALPVHPSEAQRQLQAALAGSGWEGIKGFHCWRHSFISALASRGVDQRIIDDFVGHQTDEQRRRYRHLYPDLKQEAIRSVFG